jgi:hypothetical protein
MTLDYSVIVITTKKFFKVCNNLAELNRRIEVISLNCKRDQIIPINFMMVTNGRNIHCKYFVKSRDNVSVDLDYVRMYL